VVSQTDKRLETGPFTQSMMAHTREEEKEQITKFSYKKLKLVKLQAQYNVV